MNPVIADPIGVLEECDRLTVNFDHVNRCTEPVDQGAGQRPRTGPHLQYCMVFGQVHEGDHPVADPLVLEEVLAQVLLGGNPLV